MTILSPAAPTVSPRFTAPRYASWQEAMKDAVRDPVELCRLLDLPNEIAPVAEEACREFRLFASRGYIERKRPGDPADPLLRQVLPVAEEMVDVAGFSLDPVGGCFAERSPGLLQKYRGRALFVATGACAIHCRYCFRRHYPYDDLPRSVAEWQPALDEIAADESLTEVILSGGDPLTLIDSALEQLIEALASIPHLRRLRIHTRLPIVIPERVTAGLVGMLRACRLTPVV